MSEEKKPPVDITLPLGQVHIKNDGGTLAREIAARVLKEKGEALRKAIAVAQNQPSEQVVPAKATAPVSRKQRKQEARKLRKLANQSKDERDELIAIINKKAEEGRVPFQIFVQRMMDSGMPNLVEMAKIIRGIK